MVYKKVVNPISQSKSYLISIKIHIALATAISHYDQGYNIIIILPMSQLVKPASFFQSSCVLLNPYDRPHHCGKEISFCIHGKSILLLGHLDACNIDR
jgi:hypothetical protein